MKAFIATCLMGSFAFDSKGKILEKRLFPKEPEVIAGKLELARKQLIPEEKEIIESLRKKGVKEVLTRFENDSTADRILQSDFRKLALELRWANSQAELNSMLSKVNIELTKAKIREVKKDRIVIQAIGTLDELDRVTNVFAERLREWYGLYFPEACTLIKSNEQLAKVIHEEGEREKLTDKSVQKYVKVTAGMPFSESDLGAVREYAKAVIELSKAREYVAEYIRTEGKEAFPNISAIAGPLIACRLLVHAGGLEKLAKMSSSTIQLLGAEKALFRHLRGEGKSPKFGVIFAHQAVQNAPREERGKMARLIAAKLSMAARADFYTGKDISAKLLSDLKNKTKHEARSRASSRPSA